MGVVAIRFPDIDRFGDTDAYYVLASWGGTDALVARDQWLPKGKPLLVSFPKALGEVPEYEELFRTICHSGNPQYICVDPIPATTQGEARNLGRIARENEWQSVTVISQRSHMSRVRILMERCFAGEVRISSNNVESGSYWLRVIAYESGALVKTWLTPGC
ncbi:MAG: ElyC/SanA/YdcF family protein [Propionibacteriaceae bacterium]|nr:ElyC/SanA/YdcF family protein [Propionibacteriaceae bacterium]